jgi:hypothetical protein
VALDRWLRRRIDEDRGRANVRAVGIAALFSALVVVISLLPAILEPARTALFAPCLMALGVLIAAWADPGSYQHSPPGRGQTALVLSVVTLLLFRGTPDYAQALGRRLAVNFQQGVQFMPRAEVYSLKQLGIGADAINEVKVGTGDAALYRYDRLRLRVLSGRRFFFLHDGWTARDGTVLVLPDDDSVRIKFKR